MKLEIPLGYIIAIVIGLLVFFPVYSFLSFGRIGVEITSFEAVPKTQQAQAILSINRYINTGINKTPVDFGSVDPGYTYNATVNSGWPSELILYWETNVETNVTFWGTQYFCRNNTACDVELVNRFQIGNLTFNTTSINFTQSGDAWMHYIWGKFNNAIPQKSTNYTEANADLIYNTTCPCGERNYTLPDYFRLSVPPGVRTGNWNATITWKVIDIGT
jgi:hypothetical protein